MIFGLNITEEQAQTILMRFNRWALHFKKKLKEDGINALLADYDLLVRSCETQICQKSKRPYAECCGVSYEYINDISARRTALEIIMDNLDNGEKARVMGLVDPIDKRLKVLLDENDRKFHDKEIEGYPEDKYWWEYKLPKCVIE